MADFQLELNIEDRSPDELKIYIMQQQIDLLNESMGKVRRKLFAELGVLKKMHFDLQIENENLKKEFSSFKNEKTEWIYCQDGYLLREA